MKHNNILFAPHLLVKHGTEFRTTCSREPNITSVLSPADPEYRTDAVVRAGFLFYRKGISPLGFIADIAIPKFIPERTMDAVVYAILGNTVPKKKARMFSMPDLQEVYYRIKSKKHLLDSLYMLKCIQRDISFKHDNGRYKKPTVLRVIGKEETDAD